MSSSQASSKQQPPGDSKAKCLKGLGPIWSAKEVKLFFQAYHEHGQEWDVVAEAVGTRTPENCESVFKQTQSFLSIPKAYQNENALAAIIQDLYENQVPQPDQLPSPSPRPAPSSTRRSSMGRASPSAGNDAAEESASDAPRAAGQEAPRSNTQVPRGRRTTSRRPRPSEKARAQLAQMQNNQGGRGRSSPASGTKSAPSKQRQRGGAASAGPSSENSKRTRPSGQLEAMRSKKRLFPVDGDEQQAEPKRKQSKGGRGWRESEQDRTVNRVDDDEAIKTLLMLQSTLPIMDSIHEETSSPACADLDMEDVAEGRDVLTGEDTQGVVQAEEKHETAGASGEPSIPAEESAGGSQKKHKRQQKKAVSGQLTPKKSQKGSEPAAAAAAAAAVAVREEQQEAVSPGGGREDVPAKDAKVMPQITSIGFWLEPASMISNEVKPSRRRRKPMPERLPLGMSPMKSLALSRRGLTTSSSLIAAGIDNMLRLKGEAGANAPLPNLSMEQRLKAVLGSPRLRRWIIYEWFYSSLDRAWFMRNELQEFLDHIGLPCPSRGLFLARPEWACLRAALGRPRRLSLNFLHYERTSLEAYRQAVRSRHAEIPVRELCNLAPEIPQPIVVGQRVTALHPSTRTLQDGSVLTVEDNKCRVQFDQQLLGVELVQDIHLAAAEPLENLPPALAEVYQVAGLNPPVGAGGPHNNLACFSASTQIEVASEAPGPSQEKQREAACSPSKGVMATSGAPQEVMLMGKVEGKLIKQETLVAQLRILQSSLQSQFQDHSLTDFDTNASSLQRQQSLVLLHIRQIDAELQPALDQLRGCTSFNAANLEARAAALTAELRRLGMDLHGSEGSGSPSSEAWQAAQMASLWGHGDLSGRAAVTAARQKLMAEASAMLDEVLKVDLKDCLSKDLSILMPLKAEGQKLISLLTGCVGMIMQVQSLSEIPVSRSTVDAALDPSAASLLPQCESNLPLFKQIQSHIAALKEQLTSA